MKRQYISLIALLAGFSPAGLSAQVQEGTLSNTSAAIQKNSNGITEVNLFEDFKNRTNADANTDSLSFSYANFEKHVLDYSYSLKQSVAKQVAMKKAMQVAKTGFLPSVDASGNYSYRLNDYEMPFGDDFSIPMKHDAYSAGFSVMQPVYAGGSVLYNYKGQKIQNDIAEQSVELTKDNVILAAENSYWGAAAQKEMFQVMTRYSEIVGYLLKVLQDR